MDLDIHHNARTRCATRESCTDMCTPTSARGGRAGAESRGRRRHTSTHARARYSYEYSYNTGWSRAGAHSPTGASGTDPARNYRRGAYSTYRRRCATVSVSPRAGAGSCCCCCWMGCSRSLYWSRLQSVEEQVLVRREKKVHLCVFVCRLKGCDAVCPEVVG